MGGEEYIVKMAENGINTLREIRKNIHMRELDRLETILREIKGKAEKLKK